MKKITIEAYDKAGVKLGEREVEVAETFTELHEFMFEEADILKLTLRSFVIDQQREIRAEALGKTTRKPKTPFEVEFSKLSAARQAELMALDRDIQSDLDDKEPFEAGQSKVS